MQPLNPKDLIIRNAADAQADPKPSGPTVALERYQQLERAIRETPLNSEPYLELAKIYFTTERWNDAKRVLEIAVQRFPEDIEAIFLLEESQLRRSDESLAKAQQEHKTEPTQLTEENLQRCHVEFNVLRERIYRERFQRNPQDFQLLIPLAAALDQLNQQEEAIKALKQASQQPGLRTAASLQLGKILQRAGRVPEALSAYRRAATFRIPAAAFEAKREALLAAADLATQAGMVDSTQRYLEMLCELSPDDAQLAQRLAEARALTL